MEILLQWLDELDDLVFVVMSIWLGLRRFFLSVAFTTAVAIHVLLRFGVADDSVLTLLPVSLLAISAWGIATVLASGADRSARSAAGNA